MEIFKTHGLIRPRTFVLLALLVLPVLVYAIVGTVAVWQMGWMIWLWWIIPAFWLLTWAVAKCWTAPKVSDARETEPLQSPHWTPRDAAAAEIVRRYQTDVDQLTPDQLTDMHLYLNQAQALADELARHYHPGTSDPFSSLTAAEILAAIRLVADDLEDVVLKSVPGSRLLTVAQWKKLGNAPKWIRGATNAFWAASILLNPANLARYGTARATNDRVAGGIQNQLLLTVYLRFIRQVGFYLIEMNSGRLRGGADVYRENFGADQAEKMPPFTNSENTANQNPTSKNQNTGLGNDAINSGRTHPLRIVLVGQTSAGKSSLVNQLIGSPVGSSVAAVDSLAATETARSYELQLADGRRLVLIDTPGYGDSGASPRQIESVRTSMLDCQGVLLVLDAHSPARAADVTTLKKLSAHFEKHPRLKPPPVIAVLTHIDLLPPSLEWSPPYDLSDDLSEGHHWQSGTPHSVAATDSGDANDPQREEKAKNIRESLAYNRETLGDAIVDAVAVCLSDDSNRGWGVDENLLPVLLRHLAHSEAVSQVATFEKSQNKDRYKTILDQATTSGKKLLRAWLEERNRKP